MEHELSHLAHAFVSSSSGSGINARTDISSYSNNTTPNANHGTLTT
jgi:hypothetical protein